MRSRELEAVRPGDLRVLGSRLVRAMVLHLKLALGGTARPGELILQNPAINQTKGCVATFVGPGGQRERIVKWLRDRRYSSGGKQNRRSFSVRSAGLRYSLSLRDVEELLGERGLEADHTTVW
jgi:hypothetical protein